MKSLLERGHHCVPSFLCARLFSQQKRRALSDVVQKYNILQ